MSHLKAVPKGEKLSVRRCKKDGAGLTVPRDEIRKWTYDVQVGWVESNGTSVMENPVTHRYPRILMVHRAGVDRL